MFKKLALASAALAAVALAALAATPLHTYNNSVGQEQETIGVHCINNTTGEPESCGAGGGSGGDASAANQVITNTEIGATNETAAASDTATAGLNGRQQRIAQRLTSLIALIPASLGAKTSAASLSVTQASDASFGSAVTDTRMADTNGYTANDVVGPATGSTAALTLTLGAGAGEYRITSARLQINDTALISGETNYLLYCYNVTPPSALGDNAAFDIPSGDRSSYLGKINLGTPVDEGSTLSIQTAWVGETWTLASANVFCYLVTAGAYTPTASRVYIATLHSVRAY